MSPSTATVALLAMGIACACADSPLNRPLSPMPRMALNDCDTAAFDMPPILVEGNRPDLWRDASDVTEATVTFDVTSSGATDRISAETTGDWRMAGFAGLAVRDWKFEPALKAGVPVLAHCKVTMRYEVK